MESRERSTVVGVFEDRDRAERAIEDLGRAGFGHDQLGFVARRAEERAHEAGNPLATDPLSLYAETGSRAEEREIGGALTGGAVGGLLGAAAALLIPGVGPVAAAGILGTALGGTALGATAGGLLGALQGMGISEEDARYYEGEFQAGRSIVTVRPGDRHEEAADVLRRHGAYDAASRGLRQPGAAGEDERRL